MQAVTPQIAPYEIVMKFHNFFKKIQKLKVECWQRVLLGGCTCWVGSFENGANLFIFFITFHLSPRLDGKIEDTFALCILFI